MKCWEKLAITVERCAIFWRLVGASFLSGWETNFVFVLFKEGETTCYNEFLVSRKGSVLLVKNC